MPDSLSVAADSILADSLARAAHIEDSLRTALHADYSLLDTLLGKNVAAAHGIYPAPPPFDATTDDGIVTAFLLTFVIIVVFLLQLRISQKNIAKNFSDNTPNAPANPLPSTLGGFFSLAAGIPVGIALVWAARSLNFQLPSMLQEMGNLELSLIGGLAFWLYAALKCGLYRIINTAFFNTVTTKRWTFLLYSVTALSGAVLFALVLLAVFLPLSIQTTLFAALAIVILGKIALLVAYFHTFLPLKVSVIHIIVYFCALEAAPFLLLLHAGDLLLPAA